MGTDFSRKPIGNSTTELIPEVSQAQSNEQAKKEFLKNEVSFPVTKVNTTSDSAAPIIKDSPAESQEIINIDQEFIVKQIQDVLKSPSPLTLFKKSSELKENFAKFINYLVKKISLGFSSQDKTVILSIYQNAKYEHVWIANMKNYLDDSRYFDVNLYFKTIATFQKESQYTAKALLKIYKRETEKEIRDYLKKYKSRFTYEEILKNYKFLGIDDLEGRIENKYLDENQISRFLEQIYLLSDKPEHIFQIFCFAQEEMKGKFSEVYSIFSYIARNYLKPVSYKDRQVMTYIKYARNAELLEKLDELLEEYLQNKDKFYKQVSRLISEKNSIERGYFWSYIKTKIIDMHYKEVARLFYWDNQVCSNRNEWASLKGNFTFSDKSQYVGETKETMVFKQLILELNSNLFAPFLKPFIYSIVSEKLSINRKDLLKIRYLMTLILSENYLEYKKIYNFFEDIETFMDYNVDSAFSEISINLKKFKIFAADILIGTFALVWMYLYAPVGVFAGSFILAMSYLREHFKKFKSGVEWNLGIRTFATIVLVVSSFYWITNLDTTKVDLAKLSNHVEKIGLYRTDETAKIVAKKIDNLGIGKAVADILQSIKK